MSEVAPAALVWMGSRIKPDLGGVLSGIVGDKAHTRGYHRARKVLPSSDYSVIQPEDKRGNSSDCAAIDMSFTTAKMKTYTTRLKNAVEKNDPRVRFIREFYGTTNGTTVFGRSHKSTTDKTWVAVTSDKSHLWHIHISIFREYANNKSVMQGILDVMMGKALKLGDRTLRRGDWGADVGELQKKLNSVNNAKLSVDNDFGPATETAVKNDQKTKKLTADGVVGASTLAALNAPKEDEMNSEQDARLKTVETGLKKVQENVDKLYTLMWNWRGGMPKMPDGKTVIAPVDWRIRDEAWQKSVGDQVVSVAKSVNDLASVVAGLAQRVDGITTIAIDDEQLQRALRSVLGSLDGATPTE